MDRLFTDLNKVTGRYTTDVHLVDFPVADESMIDKQLEERMNMAQQISSMVLGLRRKVQIRVRQPLCKLLIPILNDEMTTQLDAVKNIILSEVNVKEIEYITDTAGILVKKIKPNFKPLGPKYGKLLGGIKEALANLDGNQAMDELNATEALKLDVNGQEVTLFREDLLIDTAQMEGYVSENDNGITVVLDTNLTEELLTEGFVREIISKIQTMRKEAGFEVMDKIKVTYDGSEKAEKVFAEYAEQIGQETLAVAVEKAEPAGYVKDWKINGEAVNMGVEKQGE